VTISYSNRTTHLRTGRDNQWRARLTTDSISSFTR